MVMLSSNLSNLAQILNNHLEAKKTGGARKVRETRKEWIGEVTAALEEGSLVRLEQALRGRKWTFKHTDHDVWRALARHYQDNLCAALVAHGFDLTLYWTQFDILLEHDCSAFVRRLAQHPDNCVFNTVQNPHGYNWEGVSGLYIRSNLAAWEKRGSVRQRVGEQYRALLETLFPQLEQEPYITSSVSAVNILSAPTAANMAWVAKHMDHIPWSAQLPDWGDLPRICAFLEMCQANPLIQQKFQELENTQHNAGLRSRQLSKCFEGTPQRATSFQAFSMVQWQRDKICSAADQEHDFFKVTGAHHPLSTSLGLSAKEMYLLGHYGPYRVATQLAEWNFPLLEHLSWMHQGVAVSEEFVDMLLDNVEGAALVDTCLQDPQTRHAFFMNSRVSTVDHVLTTFPHWTKWRDAHNNSIGHYIMAARCEIPKTLVETLVKHDVALLNENNNNGLNGLEVLERRCSSKSGPNGKYGVFGPFYVDAPLDVFSKMVLGKSVREDTDVQRKIRARASIKRKM